VALREDEQIGRKMGEMDRRISKIEENQGPVQADVSLILKSFEQLDLVAKQNVTKLILCDDAFVLDHPTLGELDSPTLKLDKAYCDFEDIVSETEYDYLSVDNNDTPLLAGQGVVIDYNG
jgi:hypothetical protein